MEIKDMPKAVELFSDINTSQRLIDIIEKSQQSTSGTCDLYIKDSNGNYNQISLLDKESEKSVISVIKNHLLRMIKDKTAELKKY